MSDFDKTLHAQLRHLIDDLTVAVDDDGHTRYAPKNTLMFSNFIGALIELMPALEARAQPAQASHDGLVWREIERGADYIKMKGWVSGQPAQPFITSEIGNASDQGASAITSESGKAGQMLTDEEISSIAIQNPPDVHLYARAIEQAVLAKRVPQWLPIETAPQDWGVTKFDVWANDARFADCWWGKATYEQGEPGIVYQSDYDCNGPVDSYVRNATHWMPLPPPPGIVGEKGGA